MMQPGSKGKTCITGRFLFQLFTIVLLAISVACLTEKSTSVRITRVTLPRSLQEDNVDISTPRFGGCIGTGDSDVLCSLNPDSCPPSTEYINPLEVMEIGECDSPFLVEIGRCQSETGDLGSCSPFASACKDSISTAPNPSCNLVEDEEFIMDKITHYPLCRVKSVNRRDEDYRCVLSKDDCDHEIEDFLSFEKVVDIPQCFCSDVPTGMCYNSTTMPITAESSFCAVADYDCPDEYDFMNSYKLNYDYDDPPRTCRLCKIEDLLKYDHKVDVVESGRCFSDEGNVRRCALESTDCNTDENETFQSSAQLHVAGVKTCHANHLSGGDCITEGGDTFCTNHADACEIPSEFVQRTTCMIFSDIASQNDEPMYFGQCLRNRRLPSQMKEYRCAWHSSECNDDEEWYPASTDVDWYERCRCEDVETGACENNGKYYCAVSSDSCASDDVYISSFEAKEISLDCRLCKRSRVVKNSTISPTNNPTGSPTQAESPLPPRPTVIGLDKLDSPVPPTPVPPTPVPPTPAVIGLDEVDRDIDNSMEGGTDDYDDFVFIEEDVSKKPTDKTIIIAGSIGGVVLFIIALYIAYYRRPRPPKLNLAWDNDTITGAVV